MSNKLLQILSKQIQLIMVVVSLVPVSRPKTRNERDLNLSKFKKNSVIRITRRFDFDSITLHFNQSILYHFQRSNKPVSVLIWFGILIKKIW